MAPPKFETVISEETKLTNKILVEANKMNKIRAVRTSLQNLIASELDLKNNIAFQSSSNIVGNKLEDTLVFHKLKPGDSKNSILYKIEDSSSLTGQVRKSKTEICSKEQSSHKENLSSFHKEEVNDTIVKNYEEYLAKIPSDYETGAIKELLEDTLSIANSKLHVFNISSAKSFELISKSKTKFTTSTGAHYLYYSSSDISDSDTGLKCSPPILNQINQSLLVDALSQNMIDIITSSHFPMTTELKGPDFIKALPGASTLG